THRPATLVAATTPRRHQVRMVATVTPACWAAVVAVRAVMIGSEVQRGSLLISLLWGYPHTLSSGCPSRPRPEGRGTLRKTLVVGPSRSLVAPKGQLRIQYPQPWLVKPSPARTVTVTPRGALLMKLLAM